MCFQLLALFAIPAILEGAETGTIIGAELIGGVLAGAADEALACVLGPTAAEGFAILTAIASAAELGGSIYNLATAPSLIEKATAFADGPPTSAIDLETELSSGDSHLFASALGSGFVPDSAIDLTTGLTLSTAAGLSFEQGTAEQLLQQVADLVNAQQPAAFADEQAFTAVSAPASTPGVGALDGTVGQDLSVANEAGAPRTLEFISRDGADGSLATTGYVGADAGPADVGFASHLERADEFFHDVGPPMPPPLDPPSVVDTMVAPAGGTVVDVPGGKVAVPEGGTITTLSNGTVQYEPPPPGYVAPPSDEYVPSTPHAGAGTVPTYGPSAPIPTYGPDLPVPTYGPTQAEAGFVPPPEALKAFPPAEVPPWLPPAEAIRRIEAAQREAARGADELRVAARRPDPETAEKLQRWEREQEHLYDKRYALQRLVDDLTERGLALSIAETGPGLVARAGGAERAIAAEVRASGRLAGVTETESLARAATPRVPAAAAPESAAAASQGARHLVEYLKGALDAFRLTGSPGPQPGPAATASAAPGAGPPAVGATVGKPPPNADRARVPTEKLRDYALSPTHPVGKNKALVFDRVLGYNDTNYEGLVDQLREGVQRTPVGRVDVTPNGVGCVVDIPVTGPNGNSALVRTKWWYDPGSTTPRLQSLWVK